MDNDIESFFEASELLKTIAHPVRLCIIAGLLEKGCCNVTTMHSCLEIPQPTVSRHLQKLKSLGIIDGERSGLEIHYKVIDTRVIDIINLLVK